MGNASRYISIQNTYSNFRVAIKMRNPGRPRTTANMRSGMVSAKFFGGDMITFTMSTPVSVIAAGNTTVPMRSINTTNYILKQKVPHRFRTLTSSIELCSVELIHRPRYERRNLMEEGMIVLHTARGQNIVLRCGKFRSIRVLKNRSLPKRRRFFLSSVLTTDSLYSCMISGLRKTGTHFSAPSGSGFQCFEAIHGKTMLASPTSGGTMLVDKSHRQKHLKNPLPR